MKCEYMYLYLNPKDYVWVHINFMLNEYLTLQWLFGRLHPRGVDLQVEDVWSTWVPEDGMMPILLPCLWFWSPSSCAMIFRCQESYLFYLLNLCFEEPLSSYEDVYEIFRIMSLCCFMLWFRCDCLWITMFYYCFGLMVM